MARSKSSGTGTKKNTWKGFFNHHLSDEEKKGIKKMLSGKDCGDTSSYIAELAAGGYKTSLSYNESNDSYIASVTGRENSENAGYTFSVNHTDARTALFAVWFVVSQVYLYGEWNLEEDKTVNW